MVFYEEQLTGRSTTNTFIYIFANYGWYIMISLLAVLYMYHKWLKSIIESYIKRREENTLIAKYHKNPDIFLARQLAQEQRCIKLQEKYKQDAENYQKKMEEREEEKEARRRKEFFEKHGDQGGYKLGSPNEKPTSFRPEYNPLMGTGSSSNYRPPRRSVCSRGGGCG